MTTTNEELIAQARRIEAMGESLGDELSGIWLFARNARIVLEAARAVSLPDRETGKRAVDALYALGVGSNLIPEYQADLIHEAVDAVLAALSTQPAAGEVEPALYRGDLSDMVNRETKGI